MSKIMGSRCIQYTIFVINKTVFEDEFGCI